MAACDHPAAAAVAGAVRKRRCIAVGSTEEYEETCCLGEGAFGVVIKARHRITGQTVAIKYLTAPDDGGRAAAADLLREASVLDACGGNPFVVGFHGLVRHPATADLCLVMECVGPSLQYLLRDQRRRALPEATVRAAMWQLLTGARDMHRKHIIHRDIKPDNILVSDDRNVVKICDFGLAMPMSVPPPYSPAGTLWYEAPEVLLGKADYDALVDTWSLGCVMAELISGRALFQGMDDEGQLHAIIDVLGVPDDMTWPWFSSTTFATEVLPELDYVQRYNRLREVFPETMLSKQGFEVLNGLLAWNPDKRLTATAALKHSWFANVGALALPRKEETASKLLPNKKDLVIVAPDMHKRRRLQCV